MKYLILGIAGKATSGKDTFYEILKNLLPEYDVQRVSIGDNIRVDINNLGYFTQNNLNIFDFTPEEKESVRPLMVEYANFARKRSNGTYFLDRIDKRLQHTISQAEYQSPSNTPQKPLILCITDIRFQEYENDEVNWIQHKHKGKLIYIDRYDWVYGNKTPIPFVNETEKEQIPILMKRADHTVSWPTTPTLKLEAHVNPIANEIRQNWLPI
jgi:hypothetical protein